MSGYVYVSPKCAEIMRRKGFTIDQEAIHMGGDPEGETATGLSDIASRIETLEQAVAYIAMNIGEGSAGGFGDYGEEGESDDAAGMSPSPHPDGNFAQGFSETSELRKEIGVSKLGNQLGPTGVRSAAERSAAGNDAAVVTGGSQTLPPGSRKAEGGNYLPNAAGSIAQVRRLSTTTNTLNMGKTGGWGTSDASLKRAAVYAQMDRQTTARINSVNEANKRLWRR
jgi:hypothetical protein